MAAHLLRVVAAGVALAAALIALPNLWVARASGRRAYATPSAAPSRSIAIVPGAAVWGGQPLTSLTARLETALTLYRAGRVRRILISGNDRAGSPEVPVMQRWLLARGVPAADILADGRGSRTRNTMLDAAELGVADAIVCTQALYVDRAVFLARQAGIDAIGIGVASDASRSWRNVGAEGLKTTLAFFESYLREGPAAQTGRIAVAVR
jgi:SanA protein